MKLKAFVKRYCSSIEEITVRLLSYEIGGTAWADVELGHGIGPYLDHMSRPALDKYKELAQAELLCVMGSADREGIFLSVEMEMPQLVLLAGLIEAGELPGRTWRTKGGGGT